MTETLVARPTTGIPLDSPAVRERLVEALNLDLIGPGANHELAAERLPGWIRPSNWYLTGFLTPSGTPPENSADMDEDDEIDEVPGAAGLAEESMEEREAAKKGFFPSSMGLSFLVAADTDELVVTVRWGDYARGEIEGREGAKVPVWQRRPEQQTVPVTLTRSGDHPVPRSGGLSLHLAVKPSANLTDAALDRNFELGILLRDRALATSVSSHFQGLIDGKWLVPLPT